MSEFELNDILSDIATIKSAATDFKIKCDKTNGNIDTDLLDELVDNALTDLNYRLGEIQDEIAQAELDERRGDYYASR